MGDSEKELPKTTPLFKGSCACGRITYEGAKLPEAAQICTFPLSTLVACVRITMLTGTPSTGKGHCVSCRKLSGGPYQAFIDVESKGITFYDNIEHLRYEGLPEANFGGITYLRLSNIAERAFCVSCHTSLAMRYQQHKDITGLTLGTVDDESVTDEKVKEALKPTAHIFVSQKAWWVDVEKDGMPVHERFNGDWEQRVETWDGK